MQYLNTPLYLKNNLGFRLNNYIANSDSKNKKLIYFSLFVLLFSVLRGLVPLITKNGSLALPTYNISYFLGLVLGGYGFYKVFISKEQITKKEIKYLFILNFVFTLYWLLPLLILVPSISLFVSLAYKCWFPFAMYAFLKVPEEKLIPVFKIITLVVAGFVFLDFISLNTELIPNGRDHAFARYKLLRPDFIITSRTGIFLRPNGILGAGLLPHDSANLLAVFSVYWLALSFRKNKGRYTFLILTFTSIITLLLSQSASNIVASLFGLFIVIFVYRRKVFSLMNTLKLSFFIFPLFIWIYYKYLTTIQILGHFYYRMSGGDWAGMKGFEDTNPLSSIFFSFFFGYGQTLKLMEDHFFDEVAFVKVIFDFGILHAIIFFLLLSAPIFIYKINKYRFNKMKVFPYVIAIFVGFLSLWHYGSLLRTTNIFVFFAMYGQFMRMYFIERIKYI